MLTAIEFNDKLQLMAGEVSKVSTYGRLAPKVMLLEWRLSQMLPQPLFGFCHVATQGSRARDAVVSRTLRCLCHPPPTPTPPRRALRAREEGSRYVLAEMFNSKIAITTERP